MYYFIWWFWPTNFSFFLVMRLFLLLFWFKTFLKGLVLIFFVMWRLIILLLLGILLWLKLVWVEIRVERGRRVRTHFGRRLARHLLWLLIKILHVIGMLWVLHRRHLWRRNHAIIWWWLLHKMRRIERNIYINWLRLIFSMFF